MVQKVSLLSKSNERWAFMLEVSIVNKDEKELYTCKDNSVDFIYNAEYAGGDKIVIKKKDTEHVAIT